MWIQPADRISPAFLVPVDAYVCVCVCLVLYSFITCVGLCIQHHKEIFTVRTPAGAPSSHTPPPTHGNLLQSYNITFGIQTFLQSPSRRSCVRACVHASTCVKFCCLHPLMQGPYPAAALIRICVPIPCMGSEQSC